MLKSESAEGGGITWGVDGYGVRHFVCLKCEKYLGVDEDAAKCISCKAVAPEEESISHPPLSVGKALSAQYTAEQAAAKLREYKAAWLHRLWE